MEDGVPVTAHPRMSLNGEKIRVSLDDLCKCVDSWQLTDFPNVGDPLRMSTATSHTAPRMTRTSFACECSPACQWSPRRTPREDWLSLSCTKCTGATFSQNSRSLNDSKKYPLSSPNTRGSMTTRSSIPVSMIFIICRCIF